VAAGSAALVTQPRVTVDRGSPTERLPGPPQQFQPPPAPPPQPPQQAWAPPPGGPPPQRSSGSSKWPIIAICATVLAVGGTAIALAAAGVFTSKSGSDKPTTTVIIRNPVAAAPSAQPTTPANTTPPANTPPPSTSGTATYTTGTYAADYPAGWSIVEDNVDKGAYTETRMQSPDGAAAVLIDRTPGNPQDPQLEAEGVESQTARTAGYRRISFGPTTLGGKPGWAWVFRLPSGRRVDYFTNTGGGRFAVLGTGSDFNTAVAAARGIAESLR
jgi:hypothetical protein